MRKSKKVEHLETVLQCFDEDGDGKISPTELRDRIKLMGCDQLLLEEAVDGVESLDSDGDGLLGLDDLAQLMELGDGDDDQEKVKDLRLAFEMYIDVEVNEFITPESLQKMLFRLGESKSLEECRVMISHFDLNGDGVVCFEEFRIMMMQ